MRIQNIDFNAKEVASMTKEQFVKQHKDDYTENKIDLEKVYADCVTEVNSKAGVKAPEATVTAKPPAPQVTTEVK